MFLAAAEDDSWWDLAVREKALLFSTALRGKAELTDEGHHAVLVGASGAVPVAGAAAVVPRVPGQPGAKAKKRARMAAEKAAAEKAARRRSRTPPRKPPPGRKGEGKGKVDPAKQDCFKWMRDAGGCEVAGCPNGRRHRLYHCGRLIRCGLCDQTHSERVETGLVHQATSASQMQHALHVDTANPCLQPAGCPG